MHEEAIERSLQMAAVHLFWLAFGQKFQDLEAQRVIRHIKNFTNLLPSQRQFSIAIRFR
jgi:hypothetical protein